jgi:hypothetical protein
MICAGKKRNSFFTQYPTITFVANPQSPNQKFPDGPGPQKGKSWREYLNTQQNDKNLLPSYKLYTNSSYQRLRNKWNNSFYILSAGWGLVRSDFKLPNYDITFSNQAAPQNYRNSNLNLPPVFQDFQHLEQGNKEDIIYIGSPEYLPLFFKLTQHLPNRKIVYWKKRTPQPVPNLHPAPNNTYTFRYYHSNGNINWHYKLANEICAGIIP